MNRKQRKTSNVELLRQLRALAFGNRPGSNDELVAIFKGLMVVANDYADAPDDAKRALLAAATLERMRRSMVKSQQPITLLDSSTFTTTRRTP